MAERISGFRAVNLGETIKEQGRTKRWVAAQAGIHETQLAHVIAGRRNASAKVAEKISDCLDVAFFDLFVSAGQNETSASNERSAA